MSKQYIAESLESINKKLNMLVKKQCSLSKSDSDKDGAEEVEEEKKGKHTHSPYLFFCKEERAKIKKKHPELSFGELSHELSQMWADLPETKKKKYIKLSQQDKER